MGANSRDYTINTCLVDRRCRDHDKGSEIRPFGGASFPLTSLLAQQCIFHVLRHAHSLHISARLGGIRVGRKCPRSEVEGLAGALLLHESKA